MFKRQVDLRSEPVKRVVALGESTTWGYSVSEKSKCWVNQVVRMLEDFQGAEIELINQGIGSNVLTPECPAYEFSGTPHQDAHRMPAQGLFDRRPASGLFRMPPRRLGQEIVPLLVVWVTRNVGRVVRILGRPVCRLLFS